MTLQRSASVRITPRLGERISRESGVRRVGPQELRWLLNAVIRKGARIGSSRSELVAREWALLDTRGCDPGAYFIREWTDAGGVTRPVERQPTLRQGGVLGLFTLEGGCISSGPCVHEVDEGAGLLLVGFGSVLVLPLPVQAWDTLDANWLLVMGERADDFGDSEIHRISLLTWAILLEAPIRCDAATMAPPRLKFA
ncbi:hypothetical protein BH11PLA1_BH11PLA1_04910 [soil metagenome]